MKIFTKVLIAILALTTLIPLMIGVMCLFNQPAAIEFFKLQSLSADTEKILIVMGGFILATAVLPILAVVWLIKGRAEGFTMACIVGLVAVIRGLLALLNFSTHKIADATLTATPIVIGLLILGLAIIAGKQQGKQN